MFLLRGILISASVFVLVYVGVSAIVAAASQTMGRRAEGDCASDAARFLLWLRFAPVVTAVVMVAIFAVPSFVRLEPRASNEGTGAAPLFLTFVFCALVTGGAWRVAGALRRTNRLVTIWMRNAREEQVAGVPVLAAAGDVPAFALTGICRSKLMISSAAAAKLEEQELARAVEHELAHLRARDNLKKLLLQAVAFPGMRRLERAWANAVELSADAEAVHSQTEALELASALVKISRLRTGCDLPVVASGLVNGPSSLLEIRVNRLMNWSATTSAPPLHRYLVIAAGAVAALLIANYATALHAAHVLTEALVR